MPGPERETRPPRHWRLIRHAPGGAAWNMAVDEALARSLRPDEGVLRIYRWARHTLSFGRNQAARGRYDASAVRSLGAEAVRRPTGGREVLHDRELTYAVVLPVRGLGGLRAAYHTLNLGLLEALRSLDVEASLARAEDRTPSPDAGACFGLAADGEIEVRGRKLVGSAQARIGDALLQHGSILLAPASMHLAAFAADGLGSGEEPPAEGGAPSPDLGGEGISLSEATGRAVSFDQVAAAVEAAMAGALGGSWRRDELRDGEHGLAVELRPHYESPFWTWRR